MHRQLKLSLMKAIKAICFIILVSSAKKWRIVPPGTASPRSLIHMTNRIGPRTHPCGTLLITGFSQELVPFTKTHCLLCIRNEAIHFSITGWTLYRSNFLIRRAWSILESFSPLGEKVFATERQAHPILDQFLSKALA